MFEKKEREMFEKTPPSGENVKHACSKKRRLKTCEREREQNF
jgi:hypothetical protein